MCNNSQGPLLAELCLMTNGRKASGKSVPIAADQSMNCSMAAMTFNAVIGLMRRVDAHSLDSGLSACAHDDGHLENGHVYEPEACADAGACALYPAPPAPDANVDDVRRECVRDGVP